jgi:uncharacterized protein
MEFSFCTIIRSNDHVDAFAFIAYIVQNENSWDGSEMNLKNFIFPICVMVLVPLGNILFLTILSNPVLGFFWYHVFSCILLPVIFYRLSDKINFIKIYKKLGFNPPSVSSILISLSIGSLSLIFMIIFSTINIDTLNSIITVFPKNTLIFISGIYTIVANPLLEEIFWRGFLITLFSSFKNTWLIGILNTICFSSFHLFLLLCFNLPIIIICVLTASVFLMGMMFYYLRIKYKSILPPIILHYILTIGYTSIFLVILFD